MNFCALKTRDRFAGLVSALPVTTASRTTGVAPLAVFFDAVDTTSPAWSSGVVQPVATLVEQTFTQPTNITGATVMWASDGTAAGAGTLTLTYVAVPPSWNIKWAEAGDVAGANVPFTTNATKKLLSANGQSILLTVVFASLPASSQSDTITVTGTTVPDYASSHYVWDFGDPASGNWQHGRQNPNGTYPSKNSATGYTSAHVFENPGTYNVTLRVKDATDQLFLYQQEITVSAFSGTTYYVSATGSNSNDGLSTGAPFLTFAMGLSMAATNTKILFNRGDTWTISGGVTPNVAGPVEIGAYGTGADPIITVSNNAVMFALGANSTDWRWIDLDLRGPYNYDADTGTAASCIDNMKSSSLILRCNFDGFLDSVTNYSAQNGIFLADSNFLECKNYGMYMGPVSDTAPTLRVAVIGCQFDAVRYHLLRLHATKCLVSSNDFSRGGTGYNCFRMAGSEFGFRENAYSLISDNHFSDAIASVCTQIGPPDITGDDGIVRDVLYERNISIGESAGTGKIGVRSLGARRVTVRNNVFYNLGYVVLFETRHPLMLWDTWRVLNNTCYNTATGTAEIYFARATVSGLVNLQTKNNIVVWPNLTGGVADVLNAGWISEVEFTSDYNDYYIPTRTAHFSTGTGDHTFAQWQAISKDAASITTNPLFVAAEAQNFRLQAGSPAKDTGTNLSTVRTDHDNMPRPYGVSTDMGAFEYRP